MCEAILRIQDRSAQKILFNLIVAGCQRLSRFRARAAFALLLVFAAHNEVIAQNLVRTITTVKPAVVAVGSYLPSRSPAMSFTGTGFVTGDGLTVVTNSHVVPEALDTEHKEVLGIVLASGDGVAFRPATLEVRDRDHDLARLRLSGTPLPALQLGDAATVAEGQQLAFTGFPLGVVLGLHPVTHRALVSAITPAVMPSRTTQRLDARSVAQLRQSHFNLFQLDATAYPGNSGSPLFDQDTGVVLGIINMGLVKGTKESAITNPSGITYAVPAQFIHALLQQKSP